MTDPSTPPVASPPTLSVAETMVTSLCADPSNVDLPTVMAIPGDGEETPAPAKMPAHAPTPAIVVAVKGLKPLPANPTKELCENETVATLKSWCEQLGVPVTGKKAFLIHRILNPSTNQKGFPDPYMMEQQQQQQQQQQQHKKQKPQEVQVQSYHVPSNAWHNFDPCGGKNGYGGFTPMQDENFPHQQVAWSQQLSQQIVWQQQPSLYVDAYHYTGGHVEYAQQCVSVEQAPDAQPEQTPSRFLSLSPGGSLAEQEHVQRLTAETVATFDYTPGCTTAC